MSKITVWKADDPKAPKFPNNFNVVQKAILQVTDIKTNRNKYYAVELHEAGNKFRVFTHYGRTDDLETNPNAGIKESRYFSSLNEASLNYNKIYKEKTSARKGYKEIALASAKIGSSKSIGKSSGHIDDKTLKKLNDKTSTVAKASISSHVQELVSYIYSEATNALVTTINASITANGIETPLGVLTLGQIDKGQVILDELWNLFQNKNKTAKIKEQIIDLSGDFYTAIPHRFGRNRAAAEQATIDTLDKFNQKQDTLQLMRDMLNVNASGQALLNPEIEKKYSALGCEIEYLDADAGKFKELKQYVEKSQIKTKRIKIKNIYRISRLKEHSDFANKIGNKKLLFHGSSSKNWVGILSRGLLLPKIVVSLGVKRTDAGWLGSGIYFGDAVCTTLCYASPGSRGTRLMTIAEVALGKVKQYRKITYGLKEPPAGYDSCHGVRGSEFADDEFVIYNQNQQRLQYLVEYTGDYW